MTFATILPVCPNCGSIRVDGGQVGSDPDKLRCTGCWLYLPREEFFKHNDEWVRTPTDPPLDEVSHGR